MLSPARFESPVCFGALFVLAIGLSACSAGNGSEGRCATSTECSGGRVCLDGRCVRGGVPDASVDAGRGADAGPDASADANVPVPVDAGPCREVSAESTVEPVPVDILVAIDNSGSMTEEASEVQSNLNNFAAILGTSGLDYRIVLLSASRATDAQGVCIPAPLGSGPPSCLGGPEGRLLALHVSVASRNAPDLMLANYPMYRDFLRPAAAKVFLWITDDESATYTADEFRAAMAALDPAGGFDHPIHNSIVGYHGDATPADWARAAAGACSSLARVGATYLRLSDCLTDANAPVPDCTPGRHAKVCEADWTPIFDEIARGVLAGVPVRCEFDVPPPPAGYEIDVDMIGVTYRTTGGAVAAALTRVDGPAACAAGGWYFDDPGMPTRIELCPEVCRTVQADPDARMDITLGCASLLM